MCADAHPDVDAMLARIQNDLFDLGADLTVPDRGERQRARARLRVSDAQVKRLEDEIDALECRAAAVAILRPAGRLALRPRRSTWRARCAGGRSA